MRSLARVLSVAAAFAAVNAATWVIVEINLQNHVYRPEADSTMIPIMATVGWSIIAAIYLAGLGLLSRLPRVWERMPKGALAALLVLAQLPVVLFGLIGLGYWWLPSHYAISLSYLGAVFVFGYWIVSDVRRLYSPDLAVARGPAAAK